MTTAVVKKKKKSRPVKLGERTSSVTKRKYITEIFDECRWTATDFQQNATGVLQQAMITCVRLSPGFENYLKRSAKSVHTLSHAPVTTPSGLFFYARNISKMFFCWK